MSREQNYFPPNETKLKWMPKALNYLPWTCDIIKQLDYPKGINIFAHVHLINEQYEWRVFVDDWSNKRQIIEGESKTALEACTKAENIGIQKASELYPEWVVIALNNNWRPPA